MVYCTEEDVRDHTNLKVADITDAEVTTLIQSATAKVNSDVNITVSREFVRPIDNTRENKIDGNNTVYYTQNWHGVYLGDKDHDGVVDTNDVIVRQVDTIGNETVLTVSAVDDIECKITLSSAPSSGVRLYIDYVYSYVREGTVDEKIKLATVFLTAAYCYAKINIGRAPKISFGSTRLTRHMESYNHYMERYGEQIKQIQEHGGTIQSDVSPWTF